MKKNVKTLLISVAVLIMSFIVCIITGQFCIKIPELIPSSVSGYKFLLAMKYFFMFLPPVFATGVTISWCIEFGATADNSRLRFSDAMFGRYKNVLITSLIMIFFMTCGSEIALPAINMKLKNQENLPVLMKEYQHTAKNLCDAEKYELAYHYAKLASDISPDDKTNKELMYITEIYFNKQAQISQNLIEKINELTFNDSNFGKPKPTLKNAAEPYKTYELYKTAKNCYAANDWFGAHYYAQLALKTADAKDINRTELKQLTAAAWNQINQTRLMGTTDDQKIFARKYEGYTSLVNGDILRAYYVFHTLSLQSKKLSIDSDVVRYLEIAQKSLESQYFFTDETKNLQGYETARNVYFRIHDSQTGNNTIYFIRGVTTTGSGSNMIQYLRDMEIITLDSADLYRSGYFVPYAKMSCIQTDFLGENSYELLGIEKSLKSVPFIQLNSTDRNLPDSVIGPELKGGYNHNDLGNYLILNMPFDDFDLIKQASSGIDSMNLITLFNFADKAEGYGYSEEAFGNALMNRLMMPVYLLILFLIIAWLSWHFRLEADSVFKFKWIAMVPFLALAYTLLYKLANCLFKFINYGIMSLSGTSAYLPVGGLLYIVLLILISLVFLSCRNSEGR